MISPYQAELNRKRQAIPEEAIEQSQEQKPKREMTTLWIAKSTKARLKKLWQEQDTTGEIKTYDDLIIEVLDTLLIYLNEKL